MVQEQIAVQALERTVDFLFSNDGLKSEPQDKVFPPAKNGFGCMPSRFVLP